MQQTFNLDIDGTATRDFPLFKAPAAGPGSSGTLVRATYTQELDADGDKTIKIRNLTTSVDLTNTLDVDALGADAGADMVLASTNVAWKAGDLIGAVYTVTTAGSVAPGECTLTIQADLGVGTGGPALMG
jgi:hypothetical protein